MYRQEETTYKEATECIHAVYERNEGEGGGWVHAQGECSYQSDTRQAGEWASLFVIVCTFIG